MSLLRPHVSPVSLGLRALWSTPACFMAKAKGPRPNRNVKLGIVLKEDVEGLGNTGSTVQVAPGYARNYLIPQRLAVYATPENVKRWGHLAQEQQQASSQQGASKTSEEQVAAVLANRVLRIHQANTPGWQFLAETIALAARNQLRLDIPAGRIHLSAPIAKYGEHVVSVTTDAAEYPLKVLVKQTGKTWRHRPSARPAQKAPEA